MKTKSVKRTKKRTAILVIHGIGEQEPFETLDSFAANFVKFVDYLPPLEHKMVSRRGAGGVEWQESFVSIERPNEAPLDVHEFYWAYMTEEQISIQEVIRWVGKTLKATEKFYKENLDLQREYEQRRGKEPFPLRNVLRLLRWTAVLSPFVKLAWALASPFSKLSVTNWFHSLLDKFGWVVTGYIGDIAVYTTTDEKSRYFKIRQQILDESQALVEQILTDDSYDRVILAGHSLGSVIAYDTLNRINIKTNVAGRNSVPISKLAGFVTFGSPLDKIAFFFREHSEVHQYVRRQILAHLNSFKSKPLDTQPNGPLVTDPLARNLDFIPWANYYAHNDPVSGHLDFYSVDLNKEVHLPEPWGVAHTGYWSCREFYEDVAERFLKGYAGSEESTI